MTGLPRSALMATWFNAWVAGNVPVDDAIAAVLADDAAHDVIGLAPDSVPLSAAWLTLRGRGARWASLALPAPGDPLGLAGTVPFNKAALDAGQAVVFGDITAGFVPTAVGRGVFWQSYDANSPTTLASVQEAERLLREQLLRTGREVADLDVAKWRPEVAEALADVRQLSDGVLPPGYGQRAQRVAALAVRCLRIADLGLEDDGAALTAGAANSRQRSLRELHGAARTAVVAACTERHGD